MATNGTLPGWTKAELQQFEELLLERRLLLSADLNALEAEELRDAPETAPQASHLADLGSDRAASDLSLGCRESAYEEIRQIDEALDRIRDGSYGACETCDQPMPRERLEAIPYARLCLSCKLAEER